MAAFRDADGPSIDSNDLRNVTGWQAFEGAVIHLLTVLVRARTSG
jgi:hypothetical protein